VRIIFKSNKLQKQCEKHKEAVKRWGSECSELIIRRIGELQASPTLSDFRRLPAPKCHRLTGKRKGLYAANVKQPYRLILKPLNEQLEEVAIDQEEEKLIKNIKIIKVEDYHGQHKK